MPKHNNLGSKHSLLIKFGQFMSYSKINNFIKKFYKKRGLETSSRPFCVCKELATTSMENEIFEAIYLYKTCNSYRNYSKSACWPPQIPFYRRFFENQKGPGTSFQATLSIKFYDKRRYLVLLHKLAKLHYRLCLFPKLFNNMYFVFHA